MKRANHAQLCLFNALYFQALSGDVTERDLHRLECTSQQVARDDNRERELLNAHAKRGKVDPIEPGSRPRFLQFFSSPLSFTFCASSLSFPLGIHYTLASFNPQRERCRIHQTDSTSTRSSPPTVGCQDHRLNQRTEEERVPQQERVEEEIRRRRRSTLPRPRSGLQYTLATRRTRSVKPRERRTVRRPRWKAKVRRVSLDLWIENADSPLTPIGLPLAFGVQSRVQWDHRELLTWDRRGRARQSRREEPETR